MTICLFTPEHDLCMANGGAHYVPPASALQLAADCAGVMRYIYGDEAECFSVPQFLAWLSAHPLAEAGASSSAGVAAGATALAGTSASAGASEAAPLIPWGWTEALRCTLLAAGVAEARLPSQQQVAQVRQLQHRATGADLLRWLSGQTGSTYPVGLITEASQLLPWQKEQGALVLKAPWSGSGRGLRWLRAASPLAAGGGQAETRKGQAAEPGDGQAPAEGQGLEDKALFAWIDRTVKHQGCVMVEPWLPVLQDFAMEFYLGVMPAALSSVRPSASLSGITFLGYSLFENHAGVYAGNRLLPDAQVEAWLGQYIPVAQLHHVALLLSHWLSQHLLPCYQGPLGVDMFIHQSPRGPRLRPVSEVNMRHTMGLAAHEYLLRHPEDEGRHFSLRHDASRQPAYRITVD